LYRLSRAIFSTDVDANGVELGALFAEVEKESDDFANDKDLLEEEIETLNLWDIFCILQNE
jgi:hypothetical protein